MTAGPLYARCTELDVDNSYKGNDLIYSPNKNANGM